MTPRQQVTWAGEVVAAAAFLFMIAATSFAVALVWAGGAP